MEKLVFQEILNEITLPFIIYEGNDLLLQTVNREAQILLGISKGVEGKPLSEVLQAGGQERLIDSAHKALTSGSEQKLQHVILELSDNHIKRKVQVDLHSKPLKREDGSVWGILQMLKEVSGPAVDNHEDRKEQYRLIALVENSSDLIGITDMQGNVTYLNKAGQMLMGASSIDECYRPSVDYFIYEDYIRLRPEIQVSMAEKGMWRGEISYRHFKTGEPILCDLNAFVITDPVSGQPIGMASVTRDLRATQAARKEQQKLFTLVENSADLMSILEPNGLNSYINKAGRELLGFESEKEVLSTPISDLHSPEHFEQVSKEVLPALEKFGRWEGQMIVRHLKTAEEFPIFNKSIRIDDPKTGQMVAVGALMRDMRPELAAQKALSDSEKLFREITTAAPAALWMCDDAQRISYVNKVWEEWTGQPLEAQLGEPVCHTVLPADREMAELKFGEDFKDRKFHHCQFRVSNGNTIRWIIRTGNPHYDSKGEFIGYIGACVDITELKQLQEQKDQFLGIASHELKTPVTSIKAYTQVLESMLRDSGDTKKADMVKKMDAQVNRLINLIGDLLDVTKIQTGKLQFNDRYFDFNEMVKELVEDVGRTSKKHSIITHLEETGEVYADRERIGQVVTNLITNAIKYSPNADRIEVYTRIENNNVRLCVQDFGIGIPREKKDKVFEQFYRVSGDEQHTFPGLGLGLYISSEIVKREGGKIWVTSMEGRGSTFCFSIPATGNKKND
ncbi:PAS domain-containing sensor histidine kinase [Desertivirga arenae]|uniref:PAS domain-containing sensor histidine kinase n=1 Tax=Desertivirga arenae TaxID=2810309 RepID=UPI001A96EEE3|nr:PAS domain-containing sensor histidine kinase [Pedobacter sp. SYSU D00823]